jgi:PiT family inorganic phosphate transporter
VGGFGGVVWSGVFKTAGGIVWSPVIGIFVALLLVLLVSWLCVRSTPSRVDGLFRRLQLLSASLLSLGHGGNDAQKTMGVIAALLFAHGMTKGVGEIPFWVVIACQAAIALGTLFGGWRIVRTMGSRITRLTPMQGVCAETAGATMLFLATSLGIPVSTTHTITGAIIGVGTARRASAVRWGVARRVVIAWIITIPAAGTMGAIFYEVSRLFH